MLNLGQHLVGVDAQLAQIDFSVANAPGEGVLDCVRLLVDLFLHVVAVDALIARVVLQVGFDIRAFNLRA